MRVYILAFCLFLAIAVGETRPEPTIEERWGIQVVSLRLSAADHLVDFRYKVVDADKATPLHVRQTKPYLEAQGKQFTVFSSPRVGPLRSSYQPQAGLVYGIMFVNSHKALKAGDRVSIIIGDFRADGLKVQ